MLFLDCEFNGHEGQLLSMALVGNTDMPYSEFYKVLPYDVTTINDWVKENVIPKLGVEPTTWEKFRIDLWDFLYHHPHEIIVADSPADFVYLLEQMHYIDSKNKYKYISQNLKLEFIVSADYKSESPHNALSDARALKQWYFDTYPVCSTLA